MQCALVSLPWYVKDRPPAALGVLGEVVNRTRRHVASMHYEFMRLVAVAGVPLYDALAEDFSGAAEMLYASLLYPARTDAAQELFVEKVGVPAGTTPDERRKTFGRLRLAAEEQIARLADELVGKGVQVVGCSASFNQLFSTVVLGRAIKARASGITVAAGGPCFAGDVGESFLREYAEIDFVIHGEGEIPLVKLLDALAAQKRPASPAILTNPRLNSDGRACAPGAPTFDERTNLDDLPTPNYDEYAPLADAVGVSWAIPIEGSRGCWWDRVRRTGNFKDTCQFCNLNVLWGPYREVGLERIASQIQELTFRYKNHRVYFVDNVARVKGLDDLADRIAGLGMELEIFYEMRANVRPIEFVRLWEAGLRQIQVGIEGLSTSYLKRVNKGTTLLQNLQIMKLACELDVYNFSNFVSEFPGSTDDEVRETVTAIRRYASAYQPIQMSPFALQEGTPVARQPERYGISNIRPLPGYAATLPEHVSVQLRFPWVAFDSTLATADWSPVRDAVVAWQKRWTPASRVLRYQDCGSFLVVIDERNEEYRTGQLGQVGRDIYMYCSEIRSIDALREQFPKTSANQLGDVLGQLCSSNLMATEDDRYLSLAMASSAAGTVKRVRAVALEAQNAARDRATRRRLPVAANTTI